MTPGSWRQRPRWYARAGTDLYEALLAAMGHEPVANLAIASAPETVREMGADAAVVEPGGRLYAALSPHLSSTVGQRNAGGNGRIPMTLPTIGGAKSPRGRSIALGMAMSVSRLLLQITSGLWFVPVLCVLGGALVSFGTITVDRAFDYQAIPSDFVGGPEAATAILQTIATSMVSLTALVLTITMVVVQLAMGQFSPRIVQRLLQDKPSQFAIGLFVATFVHAILALREVTSMPNGTGQVPGVAVVTAFVLVVSSIAVLVIYVNHIGQSLRVSALIELVGDDTRKLLDRLYPDQGSVTAMPDDEGQVVRSAESGVIVKIGYEELVEEARARSCSLELIPALGTFVPADSPLIRVHGDAVGLDTAKLRGALIMKLEPTLDEDVAYGLRLLVDIAERSLADSPFQDPTTAVQAIDRLHDVLRQLVQRPFPDGRHRDEDGVVRLVVPVMSWNAYVHLAFDEIRMAGSGSPPVTRRLRAALNDLRTMASPDRAGAIEEQLQLLTRSTVAAIADERERDIALGEDRDGLGVAAGGR